MVQLIAPEILSKSFLVSELNHGLFIRKINGIAYLFTSLALLRLLLLPSVLNIHRMLSVYSRCAYSIIYIDCDDGGGFDKHSFK